MPALAALGNEPLAAGAKVQEEPSGDQQPGSGSSLPDNKSPLLMQQNWVLLDLGRAKCIHIYYCVEV